MGSTGAPYDIQYPDPGSSVAPLQSVFSVLATSVHDALAALGKIVDSVADLDAVAAVTGMGEGDLLHIDEGDFYLGYIDTAWKQVTRATFATTGARDTAYAKASNAYKVIGAEAYVTGDGVTYGWISTGLGVATAGWFPLLGQMPAFDVISTGGTAQTPGSGWQFIPAAQWPTPGLNVGFTSWTSGVLTVAQPGWYECSLSVGVVTKASAERIGVQINKNSGSVDTNPVLKGIGYGRSGFAIRNLIKLAAADALRFQAYQDTSSQILADVTTFASLRYVRGA